MSAISRTLFLDANVLSRPVTRTLLLAAAPQLRLRITWSQAAEDEANRHLRPRALTITELRTRFLEGQPLSPTGSGQERFAGTHSKDRQILADAHAAEAGYLISEDVDDFGADDLHAACVSAVNPDLFMAVRFDSDTYLRALAVVVSGMRRPPRTIEEMHSLLARQHPLLHTRRTALFPDRTSAMTGQPAGGHVPRTTLHPLRARGLAGGEPGLGTRPDVPQLLAWSVA